MTDLLNCLVAYPVWNILSRVYVRQQQQSLFILQMYSEIHDRYEIWETLFYIILFECLVAPTQLLKKSPEMYFIGGLKNSNSIFSKISVAKIKRTNG